jgi:hypothetical protein
MTAICYVDNVMVHLSIKNVEYIQKDCKNNK